MKRAAFTLVELLVVLGIIAMLAALTVGATMWAVNAGRRTAIGLEVAQLAEAVEAYKNDKGDYPPNFRDVPALVRHIRRCYPKIAPSEFAALFTPTGALRPQCQLDEGESLVFWLSGIRNDPRYPFGLTGGGTDIKRYYEFDERRLVQRDANATFTTPILTIDNVKFPTGCPSYLAKYSKETVYLYLDSRSYDDLVVTHATTPATGAYGEIDGTATTLTHEMVTRPYLSDTGTPAQPFANPTTFQLLCAGQDGEWGNVNTSGAYAGLRSFPGGFGYTSGDRDNITNFSGGRTLEDHIP